MVGDGVLAEDAAAVGGDEEVVFQTDAAEVLVGLQQVVVDELLVEAFGTPLVDEGGDEVDAGLVGEHPPGLYAAAAAQAVGAELGGGAHLVVEADVDLSEAFHVVYVHAHHVSEAVLQEHGVGAGFDGIGGIAFHEAHVLQALGHEAADVEVHVHPLDAGTGLLDDEIVAGLDDAVDVALAGGEASADGGDAGVVAAVVLDGLGTGIAEHEPSCLQGAQAGVAVEDLAVHADDAVERHLAAVAADDAFHESGNVLLGHAGAAGFHGGGVHVVADGHGALYLGNLLGALDGTHVDDGLDERDAGGGARLQGMDAHEVGDLYHGVVAVGGQEVHLLTLGAGGVDHRRQLCHGGAVGHAGFLGKVVDGGHEACPNDVLDVDIVADEPLAVGVDVDDANQPFAVLGEVVEERAVLTVLVAVGGIVAGGFVVAEDDDKAAADLLLEHLTALDVGLLGE